MAGVLLEKGEGGLRHGDHRGEATWRCRQRLKGCICNQDAEVAGHHQELGERPGTDSPLSHGRCQPCHTDFGLLVDGTVRQWVLLFSATQFVYIVAATSGNEFNS